MYYIMVNKDNNHGIAACCGTEATAEVLKEHTQAAYPQNKVFIVRVAESLWEEFESQWNWLD